MHMHLEPCAAGNDRPLQLAFAHYDHQYLHYLERLVTLLYDSHDGCDHDIRAVPQHCSWMGPSTQRQLRRLRLSIFKVVQAGCTLLLHFVPDDMSDRSFRALLI